MTKTCVLSGLEIPKGKESREHYCCKSRFPKYIWADKRNIFDAHYLLNNLKKNLLPCEWADEKFKLVYQALGYRCLQEDDRDFLRKTLDHWYDGWEIPPCQICLAKCKQRG